MRPIVQRVLQQNSSVRFLQLVAPSRTCSSRWRWSRTSHHSQGAAAYVQHRPRGFHHLSTTATAQSHSSPSESTIYALSTAPGRAALAIIRCSGPRCLDIYAALCPRKPVPAPRTAALRTLYRPSALHHDASTQQQSSDHPDVLDPGALVLYFPAPNTVTGEDVLELHVHGGPAVVRAVLASIPSTAFAIRYAEPGEFTRRAFTNARLSLPQIEALSATLSATTTQQHRVAVAASTGAVPLAARYESWRSHLVTARGELEALIDFAEDQHFDDSPTAFLVSVSHQVQVLSGRLRAHIDHAARGELLRDGVSVALVGAPNAGKSSLLNAVAGRDAAIVHAEPGTTRDVLDVAVDVGGYACRFGDLAGLRSDIATERIGPVEMEGIRRAKARAQAAQVVIAVIPLDADGQYTLDANVRAVLADIDPTRQHLVIALNKSDLLDNAAHESRVANSLRNELPQALRNAPISLISCLPQRQPSGIRALLSGLSTVCGEVTSPLSETALGSEDSGTEGEGWDLGPPSSASLALGASERQRRLLEDAVDYLQKFLECVRPQQAEAGEEDVDVVLAAEYLRGAADCLGRVSGRGGAGDVEEVLGVVFEKFCVGK